MKRMLTLFAVLALVQSATAQITITSGDMPVSGDTLRYSFAAPAGTTINPADSGTGITWSYALTPIGQAIDTYQSAMSVNFLYALIGTSAYGYKVADAFPLTFPGLPAISNIYTFFEKKSGPSRYHAKAFAANIAGIPTPINYTKPDVWYYFPLAYGSDTSSDYVLNITLPGFGGIKQSGNRRTRVDGWGTITTPYYTTPANCIRVRSEIHEIDSVQFGTFPSVGFPRNSVEYKWLVNGEHYPALWVTANIGPGGSETISNVRYRDNPLPDSAFTDNHVASVANNVMTLKAYPNPTTTGIITLDIPATWQSFEIEVYDISSRQVATFSNRRTVDISALPAGQYLARVTSGHEAGFVQFVR